MDFYSYWGKARPNDVSGPAYHLLVYHSLDVAAVGKTLLERDAQMRQRFVAKSGLDESHLGAVVTFFLSLHDLGKFAEGFQNIRQDLFKALRGRTSTKDYTVRHDSLGNLLWRDLIWRNGWKDGWLRFGDGEMYDWQGIVFPWMQAVTGHHGTPPRETFHGVRPSLDNQFDQEAQAAAIAFAQEIAGLFLGKTFAS